MNRLNRWYLRLRENQKGQTMAEYGLIMVGVAVAAYAAYSALGGEINTVVNGVVTSLQG